MADTERFLQHDPWVVDFARRVFQVDGQAIDLSATEFDLLAYLARAAPRVVAPQELAREVQGYSGSTLKDANETLRYHFYHIRRKIKAATGRSDVIRTLRGAGYTLLQPLATSQPAGAVTFLFTDIEGSTQMWEKNPQQTRTALARHNEIIRETLEQFGGQIFKTIGDQFCCAFSSALDGLAAAISVQRALQAESWGGNTPLRVRCALHTGPAEMEENDYFGLTLSIVARLLSIGHGGQVLLSGAVQADIAGQIPLKVALRDLGARRVKGLKELIHVYQVVAPDLPDRFPPLRALDPPPNNLPGQLTSFVGREREISENLARLRQPDVRLLTLVGPGGSGKTRLSLRIAAELADEFEDGTFFVSLAAIKDDTQFLPVINVALGVREQSGEDDLQGLLSFLHGRQMLLVLDNFEHILDAAPLVNDILRGAGRVKILATSREALQIYGENRYPVEPFGLPDLHQPMILTLIEQFDALRLLADRIQASAAQLVITDSEVRAMAEICICLDGLPLALELAAARAAEFELAQIAAQLSARLDALSSGPRDLPARHRTLRGLLDWSYQLLTAGEQAVFARLAVFAGGWTLASALAVLELPGDAEAISPQVIQALAGKSLTQEIARDGRSRQTMLALVQEYAAEQLSARGEWAEIANRHARYYLQVLEMLEPSLMGGAEQHQAVKICQEERLNLRAALAWARENRQSELGLGMVGILWRFWALRSEFTEGRSWAEQMLAMDSQASPVLRARALRGLGRLEFFLHDLRRSRQSLEAALAIFRQLDMGEEAGWVLNALGETMLRLDDLDMARQLVEEGLRLHQEANQVLGLAKALDDLGRMALEQSDFENAVALFEESLGLRQKMHSAEGTALTLLALSEAHRLQADYVRALPYLQDSLGMYRELDHPAGIAVCLQNMAEIHQAEGRYALAAAGCAESLNVLYPVTQEEPELVSAGLLKLAQALHAGGRSDRAAQVLGYLARSSDISDDQIATSVEEIQAQLGSSRWEKAFALGQALLLKDITALV